MSEVVRLISGGERLVLDACDGKRTIAKATDVFLYIDFDFKNLGNNVAVEATLETPVAVYEIVEDANFAKVFASLNSDANKLVLTQDQILNFVQKHRNWLRKGGLATLFLFRARNEFFVAYVFVSSVGELSVLVFQFEDVYVWSAGYRLWLVVPEL